MPAPRVPAFRVLVTRSPHQASPLAEALRAHGIEPILIPTIELAPPTTFAPLDAALTTLTQPATAPAFHWLLFTSANAVESFATRLTRLNPGDAQVPQGFSLGSHSPQEKVGALAPPPPNPYSLIPNPCHVAAIGPATAAALELIGIKPTLIPPKAVAESLTEALLPHALQSDGTPTRFLLIRAEEARDHLPNTLRAAGAEVTIAPAYCTVFPAASISAIQALFATPATYPDAVTFTSSSTVTNLLTLLEAAGLILPPDILLISIGPITSQTLRDHNLPPHAEAETATIPSLVEKVVKTLHLR